MMDLIERQAVIDLLKKNVSKDIEEVVITDKHIKLIESIPTAYSVDAVVAEINNSENWCNAEMIYPEVAIEIVRNGGVE